MFRRIVITTIIILSFATANVTAQSPVAKDRVETFNIAKGEPALKGYDPVAYFSTNKAVEGTKKFSIVHDGVLYYFASEQNRATFQTKPGNYEPQYGGWCAYAMGLDGSKVDIDPETFRIQDGKLYVFYNRFFNNTLKSWLKDEQRLKQQADKNWKAIRK